MMAKLRMRAKRSRPVPFGKSILALQLLAALTFLGYTAIKKDVRVPLITSAPFEFDVVLPDAEGLQPVKEPAVGVAGAPAGKVSKVQIDRGRARVTLRVDHDLEGKIFKDATATVRPTSALQTLAVNISPGTPASGKLEAGATIPPARTGSFVHVDELTATLDADTQAQVQVLIRELAGALDGREPELRRIVGELGRLTDGASPLADALADRRVLLRRLTDNLDVMLTTVGTRGGQLASAVHLGNRTLEVTERRRPQIEASLRELAPLLSETQQALRAGRGLAEPLSPALDRLIPVTGDARLAATRLRSTLRPLNRFVSTAAGVARDGRRPARQLAGGLKNQAELIRNDQTPALKELIGLVELLERNRHGVIKFARNVSGVTSINRRAGTFGQFDILNFETSAGGFGFGRSAARSRGGKPSRVALDLGEMLEHSCREGNAVACQIRFQIPGLPRRSIIESRDGR